MAKLTKSGTLALSDARLVKHITFTLAEGTTVDEETGETRTYVRATRTVADHTPEPALASYGARRRPVYVDNRRSLFADSLAEMADVVNALADAVERGIDAPAPIVPNPAVTAALADRDAKIAANEARMAELERQIAAMAAATAQPTVTTAQPAAPAAPAVPTVRRVNGAAAKRDLQASLSQLPK
jgi:hypothetical protein